MNSKDIIKILEKNGWILKRVKGIHNHYIHNEKNKLVTVPHPKHDMPIGTLICIEKQSGLKLRKKK